MCNCKYYFNLWCKLQDKIACYNTILNSPCYNQCQKARAKSFLEVANKKLDVVTQILTTLGCLGFSGATK